MNILAIGDVVGSIGCKFLRAHLPQLKKVKGVDLVIANGENSADGNGITPTSARFLFDSGVDVITAGNHTFRRKESYELFDSCETLLRPANFPSLAPGRGFCVVDMGRIQVGVLNLMGVVYMESMDSPFDVADRILAEGVPKITLVDMHAEATGEKRSPRLLSGRARLRCLWHAYARPNSGRRYFRQRHRLYLRPGDDRTEAFRARREAGACHPKNAHKDAGISVPLLSSPVP